LRLYPFVGVMESLLRAQPSRLRCGAGWSLFNIQTDGNITPCPVMAGLKDYYLGNITETSPCNLREIGIVSQACAKCDINTLCGGRCLYAQVTNLWGESGFQQVCDTIRNMINALRDALPEVERLILNGTIRLEDFQYAKYDGCEVIP